jgi:hypothetical protein
MQVKHELDPATWPATGRVGRCRAGEAKGSLIFIHLATSDREPELAFWQAFLQPPLVPDSDGELFVDHRSGAMHEFLASADVEWAPEQIDGKFEDREMGLRRRFASNGTPEYAAFIELLDSSPSPSSFPPGWLPRN